MPEFEQNPLERLAEQIGDIQDELQLGALGVETAVERLGAFLQQAANDPTALRYAVRFASAQGDGQMTLFQPIGRYLLQARKQGTISKCLPLPDGTGFYIELPATDLANPSDTD